MTPDKTKMLRPILPALFLLSAMLGSTLVLGQGGTGRVNTNTAKPASKKTSTPRKPTKTTGSTNNNSPADDSAANERTYWESIRLSTDAQDFKAYLQKYPKGQYVDLARNSLGRLEAAKSNSNTSPANTPAGEISLGTIPSYNDSSDGLLLDGVRDNSPAAKAGLKAGDKIVRMAGQEVKNVDDYSSILGKLKAGQEYEVEVLRAGQRLTLKVTPTRSGPAQAPAESSTQSTFDADPVLFPSDTRDPPEKVFAGKDVDQRAQILSKPAPMYTEEARKNVVSGTVVLKAVLRSSGQVTHIRVIKGLPNGLTEQAIAAARRVKFTPAIKAGRAVSQEIQFEYNFSPY